MTRRQAGFTLVEIMLVVAIIGIMTALATPTFLSYYQGAQLRVAAEQVATFLNQGRQMAIAQNGSMCVHITSTAMHYHPGNNCTSTPWTGPGTDAGGNVRVPADITLFPIDATLIFNYLGGSTAGADLMIMHPPSGKLVHVVVALSGRVCIKPTTTATCA